MEDDDALPFGTRLRRHREAAGLSQEELAEQAGLTARAISALERGERRRPYPHTVRALAEALALSPTQRDALVTSVRKPAPPPAQAPVVGRPPLPVAATPIIGRDRELAEIAALVGDEQARLVTLTGPGGVGKTRLAIEVAHRLVDTFRDGAVIVPLAALADAPLLLPTIGDVLGVSGSGLEGIRGALHAHLRHKRLLLVLDNLEHLIEAAIDVAALIAASPDLVVVATSRAALRVRGEHEYPVSPLAVPRLERAATVTAVAADPAVELFVERAREVAPAFALTAGNAGAVAAICRRLDGLPLAIELAASRTRVLSPEALLARLDRSSLPLLTGGPRDLPARQQTMEAAIGWSYHLLEPAEATLFRRLAVFAGGFTLEAAEGVAEGVSLRSGGAAFGSGDGGGEGGGGTNGCSRSSFPPPPEGAQRPAPPPPPELSSTPSIVDGLTSLVEKSLLLRMVGPDGELRFDMLGTIREYGRRVLAEAGEAESSRRRHADWYLAFVERIEPDLLGSRQEFWCDRLTSELDNLRAAYGWFVESGDQPSAVRMAGALWPFWLTRGNPSEGRGWLDQAMEWAEAMDPGLRLKAMTGAGMLAMAQVDFGRAAALLEPARALAEAAGDRATAGRASFGLGVVAQDNGDPVAARAHFEAALTAFEEAGDALWAASTLNNLGLVVARGGDPDHGWELLERGLRWHRKAGFKMGAALALRFLGQVARQRGDDARAAALLRESLVDWRSAQGWHVANALEELAAIAAAHGQAEQAVRLFGTAVAVRETIGVPLEPALRSAYERTHAALRAELGEERFDRAWAAGRVEGIDRVVEAAAAVGPGAPAASVTPGPDSGRDPN